MKNVQDIYPLSPLQKGLLFHALFDPRAGTYVERVSWSIHGELDVELFRRAWESVVHNHAILRTGFLVEGLDEPLQVVRRQVKLPWEQLDWQTLGVAEQSALFDALLDDERRCGFKLSEAPLMRLKLVRIAPNHRRFLWSYHHLLLDGWSVALVLREVSEGYEALRRGNPLPPTNSRPYRDYIAWLQRQDVRRAESYWRETLRGFAAPTQIGVNSSSSRETFTPEDRYLTHFIDLSDETTGGMEALARQHHLTLNPLVQGAWAILLSRYSGEEDVLFGSVVSGRPTELSGAERMVGLFINTLPLRVLVPPTTCVLEWLQQFQQQQVRMWQFEYSSLPQVQQWSEVRAGNPLFESIVVFRNLPVDESLREQGMGIRIDSLEHHDMATGHPLVMGIVLEKTLRLQITYDRQRYDEATIRRMLAHMEQLLEAITANPQQELSRLQMLSGEEREQLRGWSGSEREYGPAGLVHELFAAQSAQQPEAEAVGDGERGVSYGELNGRANQLARLLRERGVGAEVLVGVCVERSVAAVVAQLAVWKAGGVYLPLDGEQPAGRLEFMLRDAQPGLVIVGAGLPAGVSAGAVPVLSLAACGAELARASAGAVEVAVSGEQLAYVIYTSGSTGEPKGVAVEHVQLSHTLQWAQELYEFTVADVVPCLAPLIFDISLFELWGPLLGGARVVLVDSRAVLQAEVAAKVLEQVTFMHAVPSLMRHLASVAEQQAGGYPELRGLFVGGDVVSPELVGQMRESFPAAAVWVGYGPTEATIMCASYRVTAAEPVAHQLVGRALGNVRLRVLDRQRQEVPVGVVGEIYIGGAGVARGYLNRPELTAERFVNLEGERYYRSGDLGRWLAGGVIEFVGRADEQVKVRGYRIEVGEVEAALSSHERVKQAVVTARADRSGEQRLVAYFVVAEGAETPPVAELRAHLQQRLPEYMVPTVYMELAKIPLTALAKVDRKALPAPAEAGVVRDAEYLAPRTATEEILAGLWGEVLGVARVGVADNFFELGGHSLLATQLMSRVRAAFSVEVSLRQLFEQPTVGGLGLAVEAAVRGGAGVSAPPLVAVSRAEHLPLSFAQQRLWFIDQLQPESAMYNSPVVARMIGNLDVPALERTISEVVRRHEALRTHFGVIEGEPVQVIDPALQVALPVTDLSTLSNEERAAASAGLAAEEASLTFNLSKGPLWRAKLLRLDVNNHILLYTMHHIISDGWSMAILFREVAALYAAFLAGAPSPLPELSVQYADYAVWQREWLQGEVLAGQVEYWREQLRGVPAVLELPRDRPRSGLQRHRGAEWRVALSEELSEQLRELSRREGVTLFMTLLAGWQLLLARYSGQDDIVVGSPVANRNRRETEPLIGFFVNMLVLRGRLSAGMTFRQLLAQVRESCLGAYAHQDVPFEKLVEELQPERSLSHTPLFQVVFGLENLGVEESQLPELTLSAAGQVKQEAIFDLSLVLRETVEGLVGRFEYNAEMWEESSIVRMAAHYERLLEAITANPQQELSRLEMLSGEEREQLRGWSGSEREYGPAGLVHELFAAQAAQQPEAAAVADGERRVSYGELNGRANQLARLLRERGVGAEVLVGVCVERSVAAVVAQLAVWKAGGVYLPLDGEQPAGRLEFMLRDAQPGLVIVGEGLPAGVSAGAVPVLSLAECGAELARASAGAVEVAVSGEQLAYVIYTSGSTGEPKGVAVEHVQLSHTLQWAQELYEFTVADVVPCLAPLIFDISLFELWGPLLGGARVVLVEARQALEAEAIEELLEQITFWHSAPGLMRRMLEVARGRGEQGEWRQIRGLFVGGDVVSPELVGQMRESFPAAAVWVGYGPTEATIMCASYRVGAGEEIAHQLVGRALGNVRLRVLDRQRQEVPVGVVGEIYIGGAGVARGYLNRPELTAERFVNLEGERYYRSGDLGRWLAAGAIEFVGRADEQVKVRGYRIEVGEVEAALSSHERVKEAVVTARADGSGEQRLVAYFVGETEEQAPTVGELRAHLQQRLPEYMVPTVYVELAKIPLTALAKVDRQALPEPEAAGVVRDAEYLAPRTATEEILAGLWGEVLGVARVGVADNFFELGGHSLLATQLMSRVRAAFSVEVPLRQLFEQPTVGGLGLAVEEAVRGGAGVSAPPLVAVSRAEHLPLSFAQQRLWFIDQMLPGSIMYNLPLAVRLRGKLAFRALEETLSEIVRRHEVLRTTFRAVDGQPVQVIHPSQRVPVALIDLLGLSGAAQQEESERLLAADARRPFDMAVGPLLRVTLLRLSAAEHVVLFTMHHIVSDGWSMSVFVKEVAALYEAYLEGRVSPLPELSVQYADYAVWQREWLQGAVLAGQVDYWREQLRGAPAVLELPTDKVRPLVQRHRGAHHSFSLPVALTRQLRELSRSESASLFMTLLAGWQLLLGRYSGQDDVVVGTPIANRHRGEVEPLIGFFVNTVALRTRLEGGLSFRAFGGAGEGDGAGSLCASGCAVREAGGGVAAGTESEPHAAVSGFLRAAERAGGRVAVAGAGAGAGAT